LSSRSSGGDSPLSLYLSTFFTPHTTDRPSAMMGVRCAALSSLTLSINATATMPIKPRNSHCDDNQHAQLKDPLHVSVGPITRARSKKIKEVLNGLIEEICGDSKTEHSKLGPKEDEGIINLIQIIDGVDLT